MIQLPVRHSFQHLTMLCFFSIGFGSSAKARIGESMEECVKRYGDSFAKIPSVSGRSGEFTYLFKRKIESGGVSKSVDIHIEFIHGKAAYLRIKGRFSDDDTQTLLSSNQGNDTWQTPLTINDRVYYNCKSRPGRQACIFKMGDAKIVDIFTPEMALHLNSRRLALSEQTVSSDVFSGPASNAELTEPTKPTSAKPEGSGKNLLEGF